MKLSRSAGSLLGLLLPSVVLAGAHQAGRLTARDGAGTDDSIVPGAYIVEWADESQDASAFYAELEAEGIRVAHRLDMNYKLFKGASFQILDVSEEETTAKAISEKTGVRSLWPVKTVPTPKLTAETESAAAALRRRDTDEFTPHIMTQIDKLHAAGINGTGVRVGIVDTGCDWTHPALGGCFGPGCIVEYGWDLVGDALVDPVPDPYPQDCIGHGTHVAGTIVAQENPLGFTGGAPGATIGCYRVFGCGDSGDNDVLVAGFFKAFDDGSDIISCSAGDTSGWSNDAYATAVQRIVDAGVPVVVASGNDGNSGLWTTSTPASAPGVVGVGAVNNYVTPLLVKRASYAGAANNESESVDFGWQIASVLNGPGFRNASLPVWFPPEENNACEPLPDDVPDLSNVLVAVRIVYQDNPACTTTLQGQNIAAKGGKYIMYYASGELQSLGYVLVDGLSGAGSTYEEPALAWKAAIDQGHEVTVSFNTANVPFVIHNEAPFGNMTARISSWGPTFDLLLKPQITAPGIDILSTYPVNGASYAVLPGTSMATPLISSVYALIMQARGIRDPDTLKKLISSTGKPQVWWDGTTVYDQLAPVPQQGAGLVQAFDAVHATTILSVSSFSFNDTDHFVGTYSFSVENTGASDVQYKLGHNKATTVTTFVSEGTDLVAASYPPPTVEDWASIAFDVDQILVPAGGSIEVRFTVTPPQNVNRTLLPVYSGYITLDGDNGETPSIPYLGVGGSMRSAPLLNNQTRNGVGVYLSDNNGHFNIPRDANTTFTIPKTGSNSTASAVYPKLVINKSLGTMKLRVDVVGLSDTGLPTTDFFSVHSLGLASSVFPLSFNPKLGGSLIWGATLAGGTVLPEGTYAFATSALRIFGDETKEEDWDFVQTVPFNVKYL